MDCREILVVDNDTFYLDLLGDIIREKGYRVHTASDGLQGLELVKQKAFRCVFVDFIMPKLDGARFIECVREDPKLKELPITVISAAITEESPGLDKIGADFYLYKGPEKTLKKNVLEVLNQIENKTNKATGSAALLGTEGMNKRAVVKELMSERRHREVVLKNIGEAVIETDTNVQVIYANTKAASIFNIPEALIIGMPLYDLFKSESLPKIREAVEGLSARFESDVVSFIIPHDKYVLKIVLANLIEEEEDRGTVLIAQDVTDYHTKVRELVLANKKLKNMQEKLVQEAKFSMIGHLSTTINREIESPLVSASSYLALLLHGKTRDDSIRDKLEVIQEDIHRARAMIRDLIDFGKEEESKVERIDVGEIVRRIAALVKHRASSSGVTIVEDYCENLPTLDADADKLKHVFINIINNAIEAMPDGGILTMSTTASSTVSFPEGETKPAIQIAFADTGVGIPPGFIPQIFNPFFSAKPDKNATGLGLSTSMKTIQDLGGGIEVESTVGAGSTFTVKIPLVEGIGE
ncbi:MAG: response regulator [Deltaproteobacteria bacterium]|nr:response regulator [Deltaproteobacteria bacterium]